MKIPMRLSSMLVLLVGLAFLSDARCQDHAAAVAGTSGDKALDGHWLLVEREMAGKKDNRADIQGLRTVIMADEIIEFQSRGPGLQKLGKIRLDSSKSPKQITITWQVPWLKRELTEEGIYTVAGDQLTICTVTTSFPSLDKRPTEFKTRASAPSGQLLHFRRVEANPAPAVELLAIRRDWTNAQTAFNKAFSKAKTAQERRLAAELKPMAEPFAVRCLSLAEMHAQSSVSLPALCWAVINAPTTDAGKKALARLTDGRLAGTDLGDLLDALEGARGGNGIPLVPLVLAAVRRQPDHARAVDALDWICGSYFGNESTEVPAPFADAAELILARFASSSNIAGFCESLSFGPPPWAWKFQKHLQMIADTNRRPWVRSQALLALARIAAMAGEAKQDEALKLFQKCIASAKDCPEDDPYHRMLEDLVNEANVSIERIHLLGLGKRAPEIVGEDLDGRPMKLSDFQGKVVLVSFWATWCRPCMVMAPHERVLVERFQDKPFVLLGVNGDNEPAELQQALAKGDIIWRSFKNKQGEKSYISGTWKLAGWPTLYLIDHQGVIRRYWCGNPEDAVLDHEIEKLVQAASTGK